MAAGAGKDVGEIRRVLQVFDQAAAAPTKQALGMLEGITKVLAKQPDAYDLLDDPSDAQAWTSAGGESFCENQDFPNVLARRWLDVLSRPDFAAADLDKDDLLILKDRLTRWAKAFADVGLEFGDEEELVAKLDELREAAPEPGEDSDDSDESD